MARTTSYEVKQIMDNCTLDDSIVDEFIIGANTLVTLVLGDDTTLGATMVKEIERWFTAHMIACTRHRSVTSERLGDASITYAGQFRENLSSTPYGQMVLQLDTTGKMSNVGKGRVRMVAIKSFD